MAPPKRNYNITDHAVLRLRERFPDGKALPFTTDEDVRYALDKAVTSSMKKGKVELFKDNGLPATLVDI